MTIVESVALVLGLFLLSQLVAIPLGAAIGKRVSGFRWFLVVAACVGLVITCGLILTGRS